VELVEFRDTTPLYLLRSERRERKPQWRFIIITQNQSLEGTLVDHKDYYLDYYRVVLNGH